MAANSAARLDPAGGSDVVGGGLELGSKMTVKTTMIPPTAAAEHAGPGLTFKLSSQDLQCESCLPHSPAKR